MCVLTSDEADDADVFCLSLRHPLSRCYCDPDIEGAEGDPESLIRNDADTLSLSSVDTVDSQAATV